MNGQRMKDQTIKDEKIKKLIKEKLGWDGEKVQESKNPRELLAWCEDMVTWGRRVRRDILVLEHHVKALGKGTPEFYGDPGDPPPAPTDY